MVDGFGGATTSTTLPSNRETVTDRACPERRPASVLVIDSSVEDADILLAGLVPGTRVIRAEAGGLADVAKNLTDLAPHGMLHILTHGEPGAITLGGERIDSAYLSEPSPFQSALRSLEAIGGHIALWACSVAQGSAGARFIDQLSELTGATVAAVGQLVGTATKGGTWDIGAPSPFTAEATTAYPHALSGTFDFSTGSLSSSGGTNNVYTGTVNIDGTDVTVTITVTSVSWILADGGGLSGTTAELLAAGTSYNNGTVTVTFSTPVTVESIHYFETDADTAGLTSVVFDNGSTTQSLLSSSGTFSDDAGDDVTFSGWTNVSSFTVTGNLSVGAADGAFQPGFDNLVVSIPSDTTPTMSLTPASTNFVEDGSAVTLYSGVTASTNDGSQNFTGFTIQVTNVTDGANEILNVDGTAIDLSTTVVSASTTSNSYGYSVSFSGNTSTVTFSGLSLNDATFGSLIGSLTYQNNSDAPTTAARSFDITNITDAGSSNNSVDPTTSAASVGVTPTNDAPVLDDTQSPTLTAIDEDTAAPTGDTVASIVVNGSITDADGSAVEAIAVTNVDNTNGVWQYSTNNGSSWTNFSGVTGSSVDIESASVLLDGTLTGASTNLIRFVPDADYNGTATITYRAWDKSSDSVGSTADTSTNGGTTAFSSATEDATLTINSVNDEPTLTATGEDPDFTEGGSAVDLFSSVALSTVDGNGVASYTITVTNVTDGANEIINADTAAIELTQGDTGTINGGTITYLVSVTETTATITFTDSSGSPAANQIILEGMSYENTSENPTEGDRVVTITSLSDNGGTANGGDDTATLSLSSTVTVIAVNNDPTSADAPSDVTVLEDTESSVDLSDITFDDPDSDIITVTLTASAGTFSSPADGEGVGSGVTETLLNSTTISLVGTAADITSYLDNTSAIQYTGAENVNGEDAATITITANDDDGSGDVTLDTINLDITAVNDAPVFAGLDGTPSFTEEGAAVTLDSNVTVSDVELDALNGGNGYYSGATLTIARNGGANANDSFSFDTSGNTFVTSGSASAGALNTFGDDDTFATYTVSGGTLTITFTSAATAATTSLVNDVLQHIRYENTSDDPGDSVQLDWTFSDGNSGNAQGSGDNPGTDTGSTTVSITEVNDAPTLDATGSNPTFTEGGAASDVFNTVTASTIEAGQTISGLILTVTNVSDTGNEILNIGNTAVTLDNGEGGTTATNSLTYSVSVSDGTATVTLSGGTMSAAATQTLVDGISYQNTSDNPTTGANRVVTITGITDSGGTADGGSNASAPNLVSTVSLTGVNDPPVITGVNGDSSDVIVGPGSQSVSLFSDADVTNADSPNFNGGFLTITQNTGTTNGNWAVDGTTVSSGGDGTVSAGETIAVSSVSIGTVDATDDGQGGTDFTINFNSNATPERVETLLQNLYYGAPSGIDARTFTLTLNDADGTANSGDQDTTADFTINVTPNPPVLGNLDGDSFTFTEGDDATNLDVDADVTLTDGDSTDFNGGNITIDFQSGQTTDDRLVLDTGTVTLSAGQTAGSTVTVGGIVIGTIEAGSAGGESEDLVITFNSNATPALVQTLIGAIQYDNASDDAPTDGNRVIRVTVTDSDTNPASDSADITVNVDPVNDTATFDGDLTGTMNEDTDTLSGDLDVTDPDTDEAHVGDDPINGMSVVGTYGNLDIDESGAWTYDLDEDNAAVQALADGDTLGDTLTINSVDGTEQDIVITITGVNDAATFGGDLTGALNEDVDTTITGGASVADIDNGEGSFTAGTINGTYGDLTIAANGDWSYDLNETLAGVQGLGDGDTLGDTLTVTSDDGTEQDIIITINGVNDVATFDGNLTGTLNEDVDTTITGTATVDDIDTGEDVFTAGTVNGTYGDLTIAANGDWSYDLNETLTGVQGLGDGDTLGDTLTVTSGDGTEQDIMITITGVNDVATIGGALSVSVDEDATYSIGDTATVTDVDTDEDVFNAEVINGTYGNLTIAANGEWSYDLNETLAGVQGLGDGDTLGDTLTVSSADGTTEDIVITINGANDAPTAASNSVAVNEDTTHALTVDNFGFDDADSGDSLTSVRIDSLTLASGDTLKLSGTDVSVNDVISVSDITAGNLVYTPAADAFGTARSSFTFSVHDGTTYAVSASTLTFNVADIADAAPPTSPTLSNRSVKENVAGAVVGTVSSTDPNGDSITFSVNDSRFEVAGTTLKLKAGISLDFETEPTIDVSLRATDSTGLSIIRVVRLSVIDTDEPTSKKGGETADTLSGTNSGDTLDGANGDDTLDGGEGNDTLLGGNGNDTLFGGDDDDSLRGDAGDDTLDGGTGNDTLRGGDGNDTLEGNDGDDHLWGGKAEVANDSLMGGGGNDRMGGGRGNDIIEGGDGDDTLYGYIGDDTLLGGDGSDLIFNGLGDDSVDGGSGSDTLWASAGDDILTGGDGGDTFVFGALAGNDTITDFSTEEDTLDLSLSGAGFTSAGDVTDASIETIVGGEAGVLIDLGGGESVFLMGLSLDDLNGAQILI